MAKKPQTIAPKKRIILSATNKGGVGKSFVTCHLVQWLKDHPSKPLFRAFDPDHANRTLSKQHPDVTSFLDVADEMSLDEIVRCLSQYDLAIADGLGSQQKKTFGAWVEEVNLFEIAPQIGAAVTYVLVVEDDREVIEQAMDTCSSTPEGVDFVIVFNKRFLPGERQSTLWAQSTTRRSLLDRGALEITIPGCPKAMADILTHYSVPAQVLSRNEHPDLHLDMLAHQRFRNFARAISEAFDQAAMYLLPVQV